MHYTVLPFAIAVAILLYDAYLVKRKSLKKWYLLGYCLVFLGFVLYVASFIFDDFSLKEAFLHSSKTLSTAFKLLASWSGSGSSIVWWMFFFSVFAFLHRLYKENRSGYASLFVWYDVLLIALFAVALLNDAFASLDTSPKNGIGLNPLLKSVWMYFHPPATLLGYALGLLVAASALAGVMDRFIKINIGIAWLVITLANILGGVWAYVTLGWGGYWIWDPVETGLLLPWLTLAAYFHSTVFSKNLRRGVLALTGFAIAYAAFITRGGAYSPLHGFSGISQGGLVILLIGLPFLVNALRGLYALKLDEVKKSPYTLFMSIAMFSLLGIFLVSFTGLIAQSLHYLITGKGLDIGTDYYNYFSLPFVIAFLLALPGCTNYIGNVKEYFTKFIPVLAISIIMVLATTAGMLTWCEKSPTATNAAISLTLPVALASLFGVGVGFITEIRRSRFAYMGLRILHISVPLLIIGILISGPYTSNQALFKPIALATGEKVDLGDFELEYVGVEFIGPVGKITPPLGKEYANLEVPEESIAVLKFRVYRGSETEDVHMKVRFNLGANLGGMGGIIPEPLVVGAGLDEYYFVIPTVYAMDLLLFHSKLLCEEAQKDPQNKDMYMHLIMFMAMRMDVDYNILIDSAHLWSPENAYLQQGVVLLYKKSPLIRLVWISSALMIVGGILSVILRNRDVEKIN